MNKPIIYINFLYPKESNQDIHNRINIQRFCEFDNGDKRIFNGHYTKFKEVLNDIKKQDTNYIDKSEVLETIGLNTYFNIDDSSSDLFRETAAKLRSRMFAYSSYTTPLLYKFIISQFAINNDIKCLVADNEKPKPLSEQIKEYKKLVGFEGNDYGGFAAMRSGLAKAGVEIGRTLGSFQRGVLHGIFEKNQDSIAAAAKFHEDSKK